MHPITNLSVDVTSQMNNTNFILSDSSSGNTSYYSIDDYNKFSTSKNHISLISLNINSLKQHVNEFVVFLSTFKKQPNIIILSEIRKNVEEILNFNFPNYTYYIDYPDHNKCGGIAILVSKCIAHNIRNDLKINNDQIENQVIELRTSNNKIMYVSGIYKHPKLNINNFASVVKSHIKKVPNNCDLILAGDFNIDMNASYANVSIRNYINLLKSLNMTQLINAPTRITASSRTLIDHIYIRHNSTTCKLTSGSFIHQISDHLCTFININLSPLYDYKNRPKVRIFSQRNIECFKNSLKNTAHVFNQNISKNSNEIWELCINFIKKQFELAFPLKSISRSKIKHKPWITKAIIKSTKTKERLYKIWTSSSTAYNERQYKNYKNKLNSIINKAKTNYYNNIFTSDKSNKKLWEEINSLLNNNENSKHIESIIVNNDTITDSKTIANEFNNFFSTIGEKLNTTFNSSQNDFTKYMPEKLNSTIRLQPATVSEISKIIYSLSNKSSCGLDNISQKLLKLVNLEITTTLTDLINKSISERVYPSCLKTAKIIPLFKNGNKLDCNNYRPISLLSTFNKIFETKIKNDLSKFIEENNVLYINQFGFRKYHSTIDALIKTHDYIIDETRKKHKVIGIFIDLKKAFDTIDNTILIEKLKYYGIDGPFNDLLKSYVDNRKCFTEINGCISDSKTIKYGVAQGSVLGPLLFSLYINDIKQISRDKETNLFADDTNIFCADSTYAKTLLKCNEALNDCYLWMKANRLTINLDKTHFVDFSRNKKNEIIPDKVIMLNNIKINEKDHTKYLGLILQNDLKWIKHISLIINKINSRIPLYYQIRDILSDNKKILIYKSLSMSVINYGIELYAKRDSVWVKLLQKCQNRILKILFNKTRLTRTNIIHQDNKVLKITDLAKLRSLLISHRVIYNSQSLNITYASMRINTNTVRPLRNTTNLVITTNSYSYKNKITENAAINWNSLSNNNKIIKNRQAFKEKITSDILMSYNL